MQLKKLDSFQIILKNHLKCELRIREAQTRGFIGFKEKRVLSYDVFLTKKHITQHEKMYHNRFLPSR